MAARRWTIVCAGMLLAVRSSFPRGCRRATGSAGQAQQPHGPADDNSVPSDLRPLLAAPESELRLVTSATPSTDRR